jgi:porphobilinogen deaminase
MQLYCLSLRPGKFKIANVEKAWAVNPEIIQTERRLRKQLPGGCHTPAACFESMKALRKATGFETDIFLMNPQSGKYE